MTSDFLEIFKQYAFLSSVLAGFTITVAIELIGLGKKGKLASSAIAVFLLSSVATVTGTFIFVVVMTSALGLPGAARPSQAWIIHFVGGIGVIPFAGLILFLAGIGLVGWLRSKTLGILTTISAALGFVLVVYILRSIVTVQ